MSSASSKVASPVAIGATVTVSFEVNANDKNSVKSNAINGVKSKKIILVDSKTLTTSQPAPKAGETWVCVVERILNPASANHGAILVRPVSRQTSFVFDDVYVPQELAKLMTVVLQNNSKNLFLEGEQGIGKSTIARAVAKTLNWEFRKVSGGLIKKFNYMLGRLLPSTNAEGQMVMKWIDSKLVAILKEAALPANRNKTFLLMLDEFTRIDEDARDALLDIIEGQDRVLDLPNGEQVPVPPNLHFMAAGNAGQGFTVRQEDAAAKDRWVIVKLSHMPQAIEQAHCLKRFPNCPSKPLDHAITVINTVRRARLDPKRMLTKSPSTRVAENVAMFLASGVELPVALANSLVNQYGGRTDDLNTEAGKVAKIVEEELKRLSSTK
ncbi:MAG: MoxR family ATPase [Candidatus Obscuribacterales bacterium]|jgi:nitric oxide reductase NorQ protein